MASVRYIFQNFSGCQTVNGNICKFPFGYEGKTYSKCTKDYSENDKHWCATGIDEDTGDVIPGEWGDCNNACHCDSLLEYI